MPHLFDETRPLVPRGSRISSERSSISSTRCGISSRRPGLSSYAIAHLFDETRDLVHEVRHLLEETRPLVQEIAHLVEETRHLVHGTRRHEDDPNPPNLPTFPTIRQLRLADDNHIQYHKKQRPRGMYVCVCNAVTEREVGEAIGSGARTRAEVTRACGAGGDCGSCHAMIRGHARGQRLRRADG